MDMVGHQEAALEVYMMALGMFVVDVIGVLVEIDWALVAELMFPYDSNQVGLVEVDYIDWDTVLVADLPVEVELEAGRIGQDIELVVVPLEIEVEVDYIELVVDLLEVEQEVDYIVLEVDLEQVLNQA